MLNYENFSTIRLSEEQFALAIAKSPRMSEKTRAIAKALLVEGRRPTDLVETYGLTRQRLGQIASKVYTDYLAHAMYPPEWITAQVIAPADLLEDFRERVEARRIEYFTNPPASGKSKARSKKSG
ncbi:TrfB-related DNA-binding protein (plasmid) [Burkholderia aenigmatica]|uniref:TrfB-related DNA-binding protein n=1 Tax=Burkholderia aenigmatica TaxID=2015348 RepID=UPI003B42F200